MNAKNSKSNRKKIKKKSNVKVREIPKTATYKIREVILENN